MNLVATTPVVAGLTLAQTEAGLDEIIDKINTLIKVESFDEELTYKMKTGDIEGVIYLINQIEKMKLGIDRKSFVKDEDKGEARIFKIIPKSGSGFLKFVA